MNLSISPVNLKANNVSFGMAEFSDRGYRYAKACAGEDCCEFLKTPNQYLEPSFFEKKKFLRKAPLTTYLESALPSGQLVEPEVVDEVTSVIAGYGSRKDSSENAMFIKQLLASKKHIDSLHPRIKKSVSSAAATVLKSNWDNPKLSKEETFELLEMSKDSLSEKEYVTLTGVIEKSDAKAPKTSKR